MHTPEPKPVSLETLHARARALHQSGAVSEALACYTILVQEAPERDDWLNELGFLYMQQGDYSTAYHVLEQALARNPDHLAYRNHLAIIALRQGELDTAYQHIQHGLAVDPKAPDLWNTQGRYHLLQTHWSEAQAAFSQALSHDPNHLEACYNLGFTYCQTHDEPLALPLFIRALQICPTYIPAHIGCAAIYSAHGDWESAIDHYQTALRIDPQYGDLADRLAAALTQTPHPAAGLACLAQISSRHPNPVAILNQMAHVYDQHGQHESANRCWMAALAHHPPPEETARIWYNLGSVAHKQQDYDRALACYRSAWEIQPDEPHWHFMVSALSANPHTMPPPPQAPVAFVRTLFDQYADHFETSMQSLAYRTPERLYALWTWHNASDTPHGSDQPLQLLDLGCGTGLMGQLWHSHRPHDRLTGVDCSPTMLEHSAAKGIYETLIPAEIGHYLEQVIAQPHPIQWDGILLCDTLPYWGALLPLFQSLFQVLNPQGFILFSCEAHTGPQPWILTPHTRYQHRDTYLTNALSTAGFTRQTLQASHLRLQAEQPVIGWLGYATR